MLSNIKQQVDVWVKQGFSNTFTTLHWIHTLSSVDGPTHLGREPKEIHCASECSVPAGQDHLQYKRKLISELKQILWREEISLPFRRCQRGHLTSGYKLNLFRVFITRGYSVSRSFMIM